jgi:hypothetical protein
MKYQHITDQWAAGQRAPFDLYEGHNILTGQRVLVEAIGDDSAPVIRKGDVIPQEIADRVHQHHNPAKIPPVTVHAVVTDENGNDVKDEHGNVMTTEITVDPTPEPVPFTYSQPTVHPDGDQHCDQCGIPSDDLYQIGNGWYCKRLRTPNGTTDSKTCYDWRIYNMPRALKTGAGS